MHTRLFLAWDMESNRMNPIEPYCFPKWKERSKLVHIVYNNQRISADVEANDCRE